MAKEMSIFRSFASSRFVGVLALTTGLFYLVWRMSYTINPAIYTISLILIFCEWVDYFNFIFFIVATWRKPDLPFLPTEQWINKRRPTVDVMIATYNESLEILESTIEGALAIEYPVNIYILDDNRRNWLKEYCQTVGINYITRPDNLHRKAGNLNNALAQTSGEYILFLDADFVPHPPIVTRALEFMLADSKIGIVQFPQRFYNDDAIETYLYANGKQWWEGDFFNSLLYYRTANNSSHWCGTPALIRRKALADVGGVATETLCEDYQTSLRMARIGWKIFYVPECQAQGVAPHTLEGVLTQRLRWCEAVSYTHLTLPTILRV